MGYKLLLADDSITIQRVIELTFADEDVQVIAVSDGDQAIARLEKERPDIVLADTGMPGRDGYQVAEHVKRSPALADVPVLLLTGAFEPVDEARANAIGCDGVLAKPFEPQLVISRVKELLGRPGRSPKPTGADVVPPSIASPPSEGHRVQPPGNADVDGLDAYFDRLDEAFAARSTPADDSLEPPRALPAEWPGRRPAESQPDEWDVGLDVVPGSSDLPVSYASPRAEIERAAPAGRSTTAPAASPQADPGSGAPAVAPPDPVPAPPPTLPAALPTLSDAFAALLAAEQAAPEAAAARWPGLPPAVDLTDTMIEEVVRRVLDRLTDRVVRDTTAQIVGPVAERLVREEIDRIKGSVE